jgi:membrane associated rhomboid family serine protease
MSMSMPPSQPFDPSRPSIASGGFGTNPTPGVGSTPPAKKSTSALLPQRIKPALITVGSLAALMVVIQAVNWASSYRLNSWGIDSRSLSGLWGILTAPLIHGSWSHLFANLVPLVVLGILITISGVKQFAAVTALVWLVSGLGVWLIAPANTVTIGASGLVFGWLAFLIARGIFTRSWQHIVLGLVLLVLWGGIFWTGIVKVAAADLTGVVTVSWQAHLFGALGGLLAAFLVGRADGPRRSSSGPAINS